MSILKSSLPTYEDASTAQTSAAFGDLNIMSSLAYRRGPSAFSKPSAFNQARDKERFELSILNDKFADYVETVRYLEAQNKKIQMDANHLTEKEKENSQRIKSLFEKEIAQLKEIAEKLFKDKNTIFTSSQDSQNSVVVSKEQLDQTIKHRDLSTFETEQIEKQLSSVEGDILMYKRRLVHQDNENTQWKQFITHIQRLLLQGKNEINNEIMAHATCEQRTKQLSIDIIRLREQHQHKLKDLKQSSFVLSLNSTNERAHTFKSELSNAIRRIRQDCERQNESHRNELYGQFTQSYENIFRSYPELSHLFLTEREQERIRQEEDRVRLDLQRVKSDTHLLKQKNAELKLQIRQLQINVELSSDENKRIDQIQQNEINQMRLKHDKITKDYEDVISKQMSLEKEIQTYSNLLETSMKPVVDNITHEYNSRTANQVKAEQQTGLLNQKTRSTSVDRTRPTTYLYASSMTLNFNNNRSAPVSNTPNGIDVKPTQHVEDANVKTKDIDQENIETINNLSLSTARPPIIIETRRNN